MVNIWPNWLLTQFTFKYLSCLNQSLVTHLNILSNIKILETDCTNKYYLQSTKSYWLLLADWIINYDHPNSWVFAYVRDTPPSNTSPPTPNSHKSYLATCLCNKTISYEITHPLDASRARLASSGILHASLYNLSLVAQLHIGVPHHVILWVSHNILLQSLLNLEQSSHHQP